jgi:hypothetical protein
MVTQDAKPPAEAMQMLVRVVFADGRTVDYRDSGTLHVGLIGAADVNGDGRAEIFYLNTAGAHSQGGHILRWNGSSLAAVLGPDGKAYTTSIDSEATNYHDAGVACEGNRFVEYVGGLSDKYRLTKTTYAWNGNQLTQVSKTTTTYPGTDPFNPPKAITDIVGVKCPGLPA